MATQVTEQVAARARWPTVSAEAPILAAKITAPGVPDWAMPRPRITKLIAQGTRWCPLTVANGPAGAGKTMALALWAAAEPGTVAWVGLDKYGNEPVRRCRPGVANRRAGSRPPVLAPACGGAGGPGPAGDTGP